MMRSQINICDDYVHATSEGSMMYPINMKQDSSNTGTDKSRMMHSLLKQLYIGFYQPRDRFVYGYSHRIELN